MDGEKEETVFLLGKILQLLDHDQDRAHWVHPINKKRDIVSFIGELRADPPKFYNYFYYYCY